MEVGKSWCVGSAGRKVILHVSSSLHFDTFQHNARVQKQQQQQQSTLAAGPGQAFNSYTPRSMSRELEQGYSLTVTPSCKLGTKEPRTLCQFV